jgi:hypothetical protein
LFELKTESTYCSTIGSIQDFVWTKTTEVRNHEDSGPQLKVYEFNE